MFARINKHKAGWIIFSFIILTYLLLKISGVHFMLSDENAYFYMGKLLSEGTLPYKDFFFAHPPLQLFIFAVIFKLFGFNFLLLKSVAMLATIVSSTFLFKLVREKFNDTEGLLAVALFLFTQTVFYNSSINFGVNLTTTFLLIGFYLLYAKEKYAASGIFFGLAGITRLYALVPLIIIFAFVLLRNKNNFIKLLSGFSAAFFLPLLLFLVISGKDFLMQVFLYHALKAPIEVTDKLAFIRDLLTKNFILFFFAVLSLFVKDKKELKLLWIISLTYFVFMISLKRAFEFYFITMSPFLAILAGHSIFSLLNKFKYFLKISAAAVLALLFLFYLINYDIRPMKIYDESYNFYTAGKIAGFIKSNSQPQDTIFGDFTIAPLVSLMADRNIASNIVDNEYQTIASGVVDAGKLTAKLKMAKVKYVLIRDNKKHGIQPFWSVPEIENFLEENCGYDKAAKRFSDYSNDYYIFFCSYAF